LDSFLRVAEELRLRSVVALRVLEDFLAALARRGGVTNTRHVLLVFWSPAGRLVRVTRLAKFRSMCGGSEAEGEAGLQRSRVAFGDELVLRGTTLLLRALGGQQVPEAGRAAHELALGGQLEALGDGLFGLLHGNERSKTEGTSLHGKGILREKRGALFTCRLSRRSRFPRKSN